MKQFEPINLDCPNEVECFIQTLGTNKGRSLANRLGLTGKGSNKTANALSGYAWNKQTAMQCRLRGDIQTASMYEDICDRIYARLPEFARW